MNMPGSRVGPKTFLEFWTCPNSGLAPICFDLMISVLNRAYILRISYRYIIYLLPSHSGFTTLRTVKPLPRRKPVPRYLIVTIPPRHTPGWRSNVDFVAKYLSGTRYCLRAYVITQQQEANTWLHCIRIS
jgi:hypothetical protein